MPLDLQRKSIGHYRWEIQCCLRKKARVSWGSINRVVHGTHEPNSDWTCGSYGSSAQACEWIMPQSARHYSSNCADFSTCTRQHSRFLGRDELTRAKKSIIKRQVTFNGCLIQKYYIKFRAYSKLALNGINAQQQSSNPLQYLPPLEDIPLQPSPHRKDKAP